MSAETNEHLAPYSGPVGRRLAAALQEVRAVLARAGASHPEVFGSVARGEDREDSDIDLLVDFAAGTSIVDIIGIKHELEDLLGVPVDLVPRDGLRSRVDQSITRDRMPL